MSRCAIAHARSNLATGNWHPTYWLDLQPRKKSMSRNWPLAHILLLGSLVAPVSAYAQLTPPAGSAGAGNSAISGVPFGPANPSVLSDPSGIGNAARTAGWYKLAAAASRLRTHRFITVTRDRALRGCVTAHHQPISG